MTRRHEDERRRAEATMDSQRWKRLQTLFFDVLDVEEDERSALIETATEHDENDFRRDLLAMLRAHEESLPLRIEERLFAARPDDDDPLVGTRLGAYAVGPEVGRGGMGTVYRAERIDEYHQDVAIKVLTAGLLGHELAERFRRERQILAQLTHPNIARLLDGGMTDDGRPYLVMPYVDGRPITTYCDDADLTLPQRLDLFRTVCSAVHHAHRNLIVHRDLKPSNILVTDQGDVMLLDFGIAKLLDTESGHLGDATRSELRWMTPEHAAPEQVLDQPITTATDTWALGVLLYELTTGVQPFSRPDGSRLDLELAICRQDPVPPSQVARRRDLAGDLDTIVLHALHKDPDRRYSSAEQLADDIQRHLVGEPVRVRPATFRYRANRFLRRNRWQVAAASVLVVVLVAFAVTATLQSRALQRERDSARLERDTAEQVTDVLVDLFETTKPSRLPGGRAMTVDELLRQHTDRVVAGLDGQAPVQSKMRHILGSVHRSYSRFETSGRLLHDALRQQVALAGWTDPRTLAIYHDVAIHEADFGERAQGLRMLRHSLALHRETLGDDHARIPSSLEALATRLPPASAERATLLDQALERRRRLEPVPGVGMAETLNHLGLARLDELRLEEALALFDEAHGLIVGLLGESHPFTLTVLSNRSVTLTSLNRFDEAIRVERQLVERYRTVFGSTSAEVANALNNLGTTLAAGRHWSDAEAALGESLALARSLVGPDHPSLDNTSRNLAWVVEFQGRLDDARDLLLPLIDDRRTVSPRDATLTETQLAGLRMRTGDAAGAIDALETIIERLRASTPAPDLGLLALPQRLLGVAYLTDGRFADGERAFRQVAEQQRDAYPPSHPLSARRSNRRRRASAEGGRAARDRAPES
ncbi:MAG: protein kinase, partial [Acidobacteriota bacterium]